MAAEVLNSSSVLRLNFSTKLKTCASISATSPSRKSLAATAPKTFKRENRTRSRSAANHFKNKIVGKNKSIGKPPNFQKLSTLGKKKHKKRSILNYFKTNKTAFKTK